MTDISQNQSQKGEKTLLSAVLLSAPGPLVTGFAAFSSHSATQMADFIRRTTELLAIIISWWVFRYVRQHRELSEADRARMERMTEWSIAVAMTCSGLFMLIIAISQFFVYEPAGKVISGLIIAILGLLVNTYFWWRYTSLGREDSNSVIVAQQKLYRAKAGVDLCVVIALTAVTIFPNHPVTRFVDIAGSMLVAFYLLYSAVDTLKSATVKERPMSLSSSKS